MAMCIDASKGRNNAFSTHRQVGRVSEPHTEDSFQVFGTRLYDFPHFPYYQ